MSNRSKNLWVRIVERIIDGPTCPNCHHETSIHDEGKCLAAIYDRGTHIRWCDCTSTRKDRDRGRK